MKHNPWLKDIQVVSKTYQMHSITSFGEPNVQNLPYSLRILLENLLRNYHREIVTMEDITSLLEYRKVKSKEREIPFFPARVLMQDFTGVPAAADLAALRDAAAEAGKDPMLVNPKIPVDLIVDHSVQVDFYGTSSSLEKNVELEYERNSQRYSLLKWAQCNFSDFQVIPPSSGICHQVNLEHLAQVVRIENSTLFPDTLIGTDSHTTMINGLGVLGWGVGGIEAEAVMLGQPYFLPIPKVVGVRLTDSLNRRCTATDLVLTVTNMLRNLGVVGCFVEFFGPGLAGLDVPDRATISNMCPEYGATAAFFPIDSRTIEYLAFTGRKEAAQRAEAYAQANFMFYDNDIEPYYDQVITLSLDDVGPCIAGPSRPQDLIPLSEAKKTIVSSRSFTTKHSPVNITINRQSVELSPGHIVIAAITSCTNTSNPSVMIGAALLARNAVQRGLNVPPWVKTSLAPGSKVVMEYLTRSGLMPYFEKLGFHLTAFGCTTCIGNSGPLLPEIEQAQGQFTIPLTAVLSGNRNFDGRIHACVSDSFLMSPILVTAYALAGTVLIDMLNEPLGLDQSGAPVFLEDIWPEDEEIQNMVSAHLSSKSFITQYADIFSSDSKWDALQVPYGDTFFWDSTSTYISKPPFFSGISPEPKGITSIHHARALLVLGDSVTTDHISPAGSIDPSYPAGVYLKSLGVQEDEFNSYGSRRGNHEVMVRGTFANTRIRQFLTEPMTGGITRKFPEGIISYIYDAAMAYGKEGTDVIVIAGKEYGTGSSRDWAAKGTILLGIKAVLAQSFERIYRSNLIGMGVLPLTFLEEESHSSHKLTGEELYTIHIPETITPKQPIEVQTEAPDGTIKTFSAVCRLDSPIEVEYFRHGGILAYIFRTMILS